MTQFRNEGRFIVETRRKVELDRRETRPANWAAGTLSPRFS
jgi:hypothetical protein